MSEKRTFAIETNECPFLIKFHFIKLIAMDNQAVRVSGTMKEIKEKDPSIIKEWDTAIAKENSKDSQLR